MITDIDLFDDWRGAALRWIGAFCLVLALHAGIAFAILYRTSDVSAPPAPAAMVLVDLPVDAILPIADSVESVATQSVADIAPDAIETITASELVEETAVEVVSAEQPHETSAVAEKPIEGVQPEPAAIVAAPRADEVSHSETPTELVPETLDDFQPSEVSETKITVVETIGPTETITAEPVVEPPPTPKPSPKPREKPAAAQAGSKGASNSKAAAGAGRSNPQVLARYLSKVRATILRHRRSVRAGARGQVVVRVVINSSGRLSGIKVVRSSGHRALDQAALDIVRRVGRVPAIPAGVGRSSIPLNVPFRFTGR